MTDEPIAVEKGFLSSLFQNGRATPALEQLWWYHEKQIQPDDFLLPQHGTVYDAILIAFAMRGQITTEGVIQELERRKELEDAGGQAYVLELANFLPTRDNLSYYADEMREQCAEMVPQRNGRAS